jgi:hypothetical protein
MRLEMIQVTENPYLPVVVLLAGAVLGVTVERFLSGMRRRAWRNKNRWRWERKSNGDALENGWTPKPRFALPKQPDAADQLRIVMGADFTIQPLLNRGEARVFRELDASSPATIWGGR